MVYICCICKKNNPDPPFKIYLKLPVCSDVCYDKIKRRTLIYQVYFVVTMGASLTWVLLKLGNDIYATIVGACTIAFIVSAWEKLRDSTGKSERQTKINYIGKHWRGELSLGMAFGVNVLLLNFTIASLGIFIDLNFHPITISRYVIAQNSVSFLIIYPWQFVGLWRTCNRSIADNKNLIVARIFKVLIICVIVAGISNLNRNWLALKSHFHFGFQLENVTSLLSNSPPSPSRHPLK